MIRLIHSLLATVPLMFVCVAAHAQRDSVAMYLSVDDVVVTVEQHVVSEPDNMGNVSFNMGALSDVPRLCGAVDVLKLLQYTPGVAAAQEGNTSMFVRGGDAGHSRILLDGAPLYSPAHLLGFFSVLNTPHLSGLTLYKSAVPARYGSSISSVTEVRTHRYLPDKFHIEGNVGIIEADAAVGVPIGERFALFASARHSYASWLTDRLADNTNIDYEFGDYGIGFVADVGRAGRLMFNSHFNSDRALADVDIYNSSCLLNWWNGLATLRLETPVDDKLTLSNMIYSSVYDNSITPDIASLNYEVTAGVVDMGIRSGADVALGSLDISTGVDLSYRRIRPQTIGVSGHINTMGAPIYDSLEAALYASVRWPISMRFIINAGVRLSLYTNDRLWSIPEPRLSVEIPLTESVRLWASYDIMTQYLHLVPQSNLSFATDFYLPSTEYLPPQWSHNLSLGYAGSSTSGHLRWSVEAYYRYMYNVIEYDSRIFDVFMNQGNHLSMLHSGNGESYGLETSFGYSSRCVDVQLNYTLSRSLRRFDNINNGAPFPAHSDRLHNLSLLATYKPSERWTLSATFVYATGIPYTATTALYISGNAFLREYGPYNGSKLPDLHHLDLSATYWFRTKRLQRSGLNVSVYNVYAHRNPLMVSWNVNRTADGGISIEERRHVIYTIMPSISWTYKF